ncbi:MAG: hypothetical protein A2177_11505 [Spirochaetes bacterium RBG_13_68_11]|nr:MAG: hypothetical protein A2177_11505 [Spirochaetes bacterium RBG_13_68_11]
MIPTGTVTFLFTDIEGSTKRWENHRSEMKSSLARHDAILRETIALKNGHVFKTVGDAFCVSYSTASDAINAAISIQLRLGQERWGVPGGISVRMAIHAGEVEEREGDYFGPVVNRVARLASAGHGGQILVSSAVAELVRGLLPDSVTLVDLGRFRLKDLSEPQTIYQLLYEGSRRSFPPLMTLDSRPNNLKPQPTALIGREKELATLGKLLSRDDVRLVSLVGPGGTGKSRLGSQLAADSLDSFPDGVFFIDLSSAASAAEVGLAIFRALNIGETEDQTRGPFERIANYIGTKQLLLLLDNFEQVMAAAQNVADLMARCPQMKFLVTSRAPMHIRGEHEYPVPPLGLPLRHPEPTAVKLSQYESVRLLIERALSVDPSFLVTNLNAPAIAEICIQLDGLPLAIELAAARLKVLSPEELLRRLSDRLRLLKGGPLDSPLRQQTLRGTIDWSYQLLSESEKRLFVRLSVFAGGWTIDAAEALYDPEEGDAAVLDDLSSLVDKSLVVRLSGKSEPRFQMLETIRTYASELLGRGSDELIIRRRHAMYHMHLAEQAEPAQYRADSLEWLERLHHEYGNIQQALAWFRSQGSGGEGLRLASSVGWYWRRKAFSTEGTKWLELFLRMAEAIASPIQRINAIIQIASISTLFDIDEPDKAKLIERLEGCIELCRQADYKTGAALIRVWLSMFERNEERAIVLQEESIQIARAAGEAWVTAWCLIWASVSRVRKDIEIAVLRKRINEAVSLSRSVGDPFLECEALHGMGDLERYFGNGRASIPWYEESLRVARRINDRRLIFMTVRCMSTANEACNDHERALGLRREVLRLAHEYGARRDAVHSLYHIGEIILAMGNLDRASRILASASKLRVTLFQGTGSGKLVDMRPELEKRFGEAKSRLEDLWAEGQAMTMDEAVAYALSDQDSGQE